jgi:hypothetical protein
VSKAGLKPEYAGNVTTTMSFPDEATTIRGLLASGVAERAIRHSGEPAVRDGIREAVRMFRTGEGSYKFTNDWRFFDRARVIRLRRCSAARAVSEFHDLRSR